MADMDKLVVGDWRGILTIYSLKGKMLYSKHLHTSSITYLKYINNKLVSND